MSIEQLRGVTILDTPIFIGDDVPAKIKEALIEAGVTPATGGTPLVGMTWVPTSLPSSVVWVHAPSMGVDTLLEKLPSNVRLLTRTTHGMPERIAWYVETAINAEVWALHRFHTQQSQKSWHRLPVPFVPTKDTAIVVGTGMVGMAIARRLRPMFSRLVGVSLSGTRKPEFDEVVKLTDMVPWEVADCVVVALPLTQSTVGAIGHTAFMRMSGAHLISVGRGATVDHEALRPALDSARVRHATLDVVPVEPLPADSWLWSHPHITITPHICGITTPADVVSSFIAACQKLEAGLIPDTAVDLDRGY